MIEDHAFTNCSSLETATLADDGTTVEERGFYDCDSLVTVNGTVLNPDKYSFAFCDDLESVTIGGERVKDHAFTNCGSLETITLVGDSVIIEERAFYDCDKLKTVNGVAADVEEYAFAFDEKLEEITISGIEVADHAFTDCDKLKTITFVTYGINIGNRAFYDCKKLETVNGAVGNVGEYAFGFCSKLSNITVIGSDIDSKAFASCSSVLVQAPDDSAVISALEEAKVHYTVADISANTQAAADEEAPTEAPAATPEAAEKLGADAATTTYDLKDIVTYVISPVTDAKIVSVVDMGSDTFTAVDSKGTSYMGMISDSDGTYMIEVMNLAASSYDSIESPYDYKSEEFKMVLNYLLSADNKTVVSIIPMYDDIYSAMDSDGDSYMVEIMVSESSMIIGMLGM